LKSGKDVGKHYTEGRKKSEKGLGKVNGGKEETVKAVEAEDDAGDEVTGKKERKEKNEKKDKKDKKEKKEKKASKDDGGEEQVKEKKKKKDKTKAKSKEAEVAA
jgi:hypothetical protein